MITQEESAEIRAMAHLPVLAEWWGGLAEYEACLLYTSDAADE